MSQSRHRGVSTLPAGILVLIIASSALSSDNWPQFRGPSSLGVDDGNTIPDHWSATKNVAWKRDVPGRGWSSPIVWGNRIFLTSVVNQGTSEAPKKGLYFGGNRPKPPESVHEWRVLCLHIKSGNLLWNRQVHIGKPESANHLKNSFASETPVTDGKRVYCYFGNVGIFCLDFDGNVLWSKTLKSHKTRFGWGTAASPVLHRDRLYLINDNDEESYLLALDTKTGNEVWRVDRDEKSNWATPYLWENDQRTEIITPGTGRVRSYDLDGKLLWTLQGMSSITIATPYQHDGLLYISSGYVLDPNKPIYAIRPGAKDDISLAKEETSNEWIVWSRRDIAPYNPSTLAYHGLLYVLYDRGLFACFNAHDGSPVYSRRRLPNGRAFTSSPWASNGKIFCLNEDGVTSVIRAGSKFEIIRTNRLAEDDMCMATPAIVGDRLLIRTSARLYCIRERVQD